MRIITTHFVSLPPPPPPLHNIYQKQKTESVYLIILFQKIIMTLLMKQVFFSLKFMLKRYHGHPIHIRLTDNYELTCLVLCLIFAARVKRRRSIIGYSITEMTTEKKNCNLVPHTSAYQLFGP